MRNIFILFFFFFILCQLFAQKDLPNPPSDFQTISAGSLVIAMDTAYQKIVPAGQAPFNLKAYGLINQLLQNGFPVKWAIRSGKSLNGIDFSAQAKRIYPSAAPSSIMNFPGGPFIVPDTSICGITTQNIIQNFGNNVCVYQLINSEVIDIRYTISNRPKVAIFTNGGNQLIHAKILDAAGITNYDFLDAANITNLNSCYTLVSEPHWDYISANPVVVNGVKNFVINGGNFFAQCQALETYENYGFFGTTNGIALVNKVVTHTYHNTDLPILQISGTLMENQGGSVKNYAPRAGSAWKNTTYKVISQNGGDTIVSLGMHLSPPTTVGGNAFFLGSHDYYSLTDLRKLNALRMYLNAIFIPSVNNNVWATAGTDQSMTCVGGISLGCSPTGPPGATYTWSPSTGLNCTNCPNPVANPLSTTNYSLTVTNSNGCKSTDVVMITNNLVYPVANFSATTVCANLQTIFNNQSTNSPVQWNWDFGDGTMSVVQNPVHTYLTSGTYDVTLTVTNNIGCTNTIHKNVIVNPNPVVNFSSTAPCFGQPTCFTNSSTVPSGSITNWSWNFGDSGSSSNTSSLQNPCHTYTALSANTALTLTTNLGCQSSISLPVTISPDPVSSFASTLSCSGSSTCFTDLSSVSSGSIVGWSWNFIDPGSGAANSSSLKNPCHLYSTFSNMTAQLTVTTDKGCQQTFSAPVSFYPLPVSAFSTTSTCLREATCFSNLSTISAGVIASQQWSFGDPNSGVGNSSTLQNSCHTYSSSNTFNVTLTNVSDYGCQSSVSTPVTVSPLPVIDFKPSWSCLAKQTCFTDLSTIASGSITTFSWNFNEPVSGSTDSSTLQNPCYVFSTLNPIDVTVILTSDKGCVDTLQRSIAVSSVPSANFNSTVVCTGTTTCFSDLSTIPAGSIVKWRWDFSDTASGPADSSSQQNPCHIFLNASPTVSLTVTSDIGCENTVTHPVSFNPVPVADFSTTASCIGSPTCFNDLTSISSGNIVNYLWDFGEAGSGTANNSINQNPCHTYSGVNSFNVILKTTSDNGCQNNVTHVVSVSPVPTANFSTSHTCLGDQTCFTDLSTVVSGTIISHDWNFNDAGSGSANNSQQMNPCHLFSSLNPYNVMLAITSDKGCSDTIYSSVAVSPIPFANFTSTVECPGNATCFSDLSTIASGTIINWNWNFSDPVSGSSDSSDAQNACHTFLNTASPNVTLTVSSDSGCTNTFILPVSFNPLAQANFIATSSCFGIQTCFNDLSSISSGAITGRLWDFGEEVSGTSDTSSLQNPCHNYANPTVYNVSLLLITDLGCQSFISRPVKVFPLPVADFIANATCLNTNSIFTDRSMNPNNDTIINWEWKFDDGSPNGYGQAPVHTYYNLNTFIVTLITTTALGCKDTINKDITIQVSPVADFTSPRQGCMPLCENFTDVSQSIDGILTHWQWDFPGGSPNTSVDQNPVICYNNSGIFPVTLIVTNSYGCMDTSFIPQYMDVFPQPEADFIVIKYPESLLFPELELGHLWSNDVVNWYWDFGDNTPIDSTHQDPVHSFRNSVVNNNFYSFDVTLKVKNQFGCIAKINRGIDVRPLFSFFIPNTFTPNRESTNEVFFGKGRGISEYKMYIFNRWGELIWQCESKGDYTEWDKDNGDGMPAACKWDGKYCGSPVQQGVYVWKVELKNIFGDLYNYIGHVNVLR